MFRRPSKKQLFAQRIVAYVITIGAILTIVTVTLLIVLGYRLNGTNGLEQGALLQFDSQPNGATVTVDGRILNGRTATKLSVVAGNHTVSYSRDGYETWAKSFDIVAGTLTWLDYVRLVPKDRTTESVASYPSLVDAKVAPNGEAVIMQEKADAPVFQLVDIRSDTIRSTTLTLPAKAYGQSGEPNVAHSFAIKEWDVGGRYALLRHTTPTLSEWIVMDTRDTEQSVNVTALLSINVSDLQFAGTSGNVLYGLTDGVIRRFDLSSGTISRALVTNVANFSIYATDTITYVGTDPRNTAHQVAGIYRDGQDQAFVMRTVETANMPLFIATARYANEDYIAIAQGATVTVTKGRYPTSTDEITTHQHEVAVFTLQGDATALSFSPGDKYLVAQTAASLTSYELEHKRQTTASVQTGQPLRWLDGAHLWGDHEGQLTMRDFDGTNVYVINAVEPGFTVKINNNNRYFYSISKDDTGYSLQRVRILP